VVDSQLTRTIVDVEVVHPTADEWEVHLADGGACVGFVTRLGSVFEYIDVLPPYEVFLCHELEEALAEIYATLGDDNAAILAAYRFGCDR
jgi:hypothetical protein